MWVVWLAFLQLLVLCTDSSRGSSTTAVSAVDVANNDWTCSTNIFTAGRIDVERMLYNCSDHIPGPRVPPSYYPKLDNHSLPVSVDDSSPTVIDVQLAVNNLIRVNDITNEFVLDFFLRLVWTDDRIVMPNIWPFLNPETSLEGIEISRYVESQEELKFWLPDIYFYESTNVQVINSLVKVLPEGRMFWARHMIVTFTDPTMPFNQYPVDRQNFSITLESFSYDYRFIMINFLGDNTIKLLTDGDTGQEIIKTNQLWKYEGFQADVATTAAPSPVNPNRKYSTLFLKLNFQRQSAGIIYRLALPILIFILIVGVAFWSDASNRIEVTLQMILVVSALYIIIGQSIPLVGYLTRIDFFIIMVFFVMGLTLAIHFYCVNLTENKVRHPMNTFYRDLIMIFLKATWFPASVGLFTYFFSARQTWYIVVIVVFSLFCALYTISSMPALILRFHYSIFKLKLKEEMVELGAIDEKTEKPLFLTTHERVVMALVNLFYGDQALLAMFNECKADMVDQLMEGQDSHNLLRNTYDGSHNTINESLFDDDNDEDFSEEREERGRPETAKHYETGGGNSRKPHREQLFHAKKSQRHNPPTMHHLKEESTLPEVRRDDCSSLSTNSKALEEYGHHNPREAFMISRSNSAHSSNHILLDHPELAQTITKGSREDNKEAEVKSSQTVFEKALQPEFSSHSFDHDPISRLSTIAEDVPDEDFVTRNEVEIVIQKDGDGIKDEKMPAVEPGIRRRANHRDVSQRSEAANVQDFYDEPTNSKYYEMMNNTPDNRRKLGIAFVERSSHPARQLSHSNHSRRHHGGASDGFHPTYQTQDDNRHEALMQFKLYTASKMGVVFNSKANERQFITNANVIPRSNSVNMKQKTSI